VRWPRGKYNRQRITGFTVSFEMNVDYIFWKPLLRWNFGQPYFIWLIFYFRAKAQYSLRSAPSEGSGDV